MISIIGQELVVQEFITTTEKCYLVNDEKQRRVSPKVIDWEIDVFVGGDVTRSRGYLRIRRRGSVGGFDSKSNAGERQSCLEKVKNCQPIPKQEED